MSDIPDLIESVPVEIEQIDKSATLFSSGVSGRSELLNNVVRKAKVTLPAQIVFGDSDQMSKFSRLGPDEQVKGYLVLRYIDLTNAGVVLARGDKIVKLGQLTTQLFLLHSSGDPAAHFSSIGGFTLFRMFFGDRTPVGT